MANYRANVEDMDGVNTDKLFEAMEVEFKKYNNEKIMNQESSNE